MKICIFPQSWASDTHEVTRGLPGSAEEFAFYHSFERPTRTMWRKGRSDSSRIWVLPHFFNLRHPRSDEKVARIAQEFGLCPQFWASDTHEVTKGLLGHVKNLHFTTVLSVRHARSDELVVKSTGAIPAPRHKKNILSVFLCSLFSSPFSLDSVWWQKLKTAITSAELWAVSAELWAVFDDSL